MNKRCQKQLHEEYVLRKLQAESGEPLVNILLMAEVSLENSLEFLKRWPEVYERDMNTLIALRKAINELDKTLELQYRDGRI